MQTLGHIVRYIERSMDVASGKCLVNFRKPKPPCFLRINIVLYALRLVFFVSPDKLQDMILEGFESVGGTGTGRVQNRYRSFGRIVIFRTLIHPTHERWRQDQDKSRAFRN